LDPTTDQLSGLGPDLVGRESVRRADAVVNPKFQPPDDPLSTLPGVGVAFKLVQHLYALSNCAGEETTLLDLVALGIVADVAEQIHDARYLLQIGLRQLQKTRRVGLLALMEVARIQPGQIDAEGIGFQLGPRMNALGRLEDATVAVELLTTDDPVRAGQLAAHMERLNQERRLITTQTVAAAMDMIARSPGLLDFNGLVLTHPAWHAGIVGIVASRLAEEYNRPTVLLLNPEGQPARGSARSVAGVDIGASIAACSPLLIGHGGHPGAAGMRLEAENIDAFRRELSRQIDLHRMPDAPSGLLIDAEVALASVDESLVLELERLAPFGQRNPAPQLMSSNLFVADDKRIGREGTHRRLQVTQADGPPISVIWFNGADAELPTGPIDLVYTPKINEFRGDRSVQLNFVAVRPAQQHAAAIKATDLPIRQIHDKRKEAVELSDLPAHEAANWYAEGIHVKADDDEGTVAFGPRSYLPSADKGLPLVIWSIPPSAGLLHWLIETTEPECIYLCGQSSSDDRLSSVLRHVAGMCKYALQRDRIVHIDRLAARLGSTETVVRKSLLWLESRGIISVEDWSPDRYPIDSILINAGSGQESNESTAALQTELDSQLAEVRAYRRFFLRATLSDLGLDRDR
jgi:single-stranded-DNA-specific exonuclease